MKTVTPKIHQTLWDKHTGQTLYVHHHENAHWLEHGQTVESKPPKHFTEFEQRILSDLGKQHITNGSEKVILTPQVNAIRASHTAANTVELEVYVTWHRKGEQVYGERLVYKHGDHPDIADAHHAHVQKRQATLDASPITG